MPKKRFGIGKLILAVLLMSVAFVPAANAEETREDVDGSEANLTLEEPVFIYNDPITENSPYWYLLIADTNQQQILFQYIDNCSVSNQEKQSMKQSMTDIWNRYPDNITEEDNQTLEYIDSKVGEYLNGKYGISISNVGIEWSGKPHKDIIYLAVKNSKIKDTYANIAKDASIVPDTWGDSEIWQSYNHYCDPKSNQGYGAANAYTYAIQAKSYYGKNQLQNAYTYLGYSSHFFSDLNNPLHTGQAYQQIKSKNRWIHYAYEDYVFNNWNKGYKFNNSVKSTTSYYRITDPSKSALSLASYTNQYSKTIFNKIYYSPTEFGSDSDVVTYTRNCLIAGKKYNNGLVKYMRS